MIRVGIGGWDFAPWRGSFYPPGLPKKRELEFASRHLTAIEVNGTFYRSQTPETFRRWAAETPDSFVFALKAPGAVVNRRVLAETGPSVERFIDSGIGELGLKLGPILWQFAPTRAFDPADVEAFLELLPRELDGRRLSHALEIRHPSFVDPRFVALCRGHGIAIVYGDAPGYPAVADLTADFVYARLQRGVDEEPLCYPAAELDRWTERARLWADGGQPANLPRVEDGEAPALKRPVFVFFIHGGKVRAPAAAQAMIASLGAGRRGEAPAG